MRNCPKWTTHDLVTHLTTLLSSTVAAITDRPAEPLAAVDWPDTLGRWDGQRLAVREALRLPADTPTRPPSPGTWLLTVGDWTRRLAHETAIHRLDAESALAEPPSTRFGDAFAVDGIEEFLTCFVPRRVADRDGVVRLEAGERTWTVVLRSDEAPEPAEDGVPDLTIAGSPDDVYRALWGRPHAARVVGQVSLLEPLAAP
ncbi:maleylpyruvate isomerase N-terminal domain-containing protein [Amycolatopsis rhabdoformis]|uniref:Maleylpyruvate isomerase N-terminal domain-containing protein n=1 Tax=Amycolatopsis rhabdoformis TaxID=1448059 RepID=A0ABZ1I3D9_9PSEU|nr:maleylpyruvate isomerase N-terminal domain-containing protein [Amycolatopsis rhabdoformis]WSE28918.1 maleylpyruvate isomerase N-terminal domain-containing protein [Amycolatopsis rhabdoformis]